MEPDRENPLGTEANSKVSLFVLLFGTVAFTSGPQVPLTCRAARHLGVFLCFIHAFFWSSKVLANPAITQSTFQSTNRASIPWNQVGAKVTSQYSGEGLTVTSTATGAKINCIF